MKFINTKIHGILDYTMGVLLIVSPWVLGFYKGGNETWIMAGLGISTIIFSLFTNYELGAVRKIPMVVHLIIDALSGGLLAASPWIFGFEEYVYLPHLIFGATEIIVVIFSSTKAYQKTRVIGYPPSHSQN